MAYEVFCNRVRGLAREAGIVVMFSHEDGKHVARCSDGVTITGNTFSKSVSIRWGSGHFAMTEI